MTTRDGDAGRSALDRGDWAAARLAFEASLQQGETPEALEGLGLAAWWLDLAALVFDARERAYRIYRERGDAPGRGAHGGVARLGHRGVSRRAGGRERLAAARPAPARRAIPSRRSTPGWRCGAAVFALLDDGDPEEAERSRPRRCGSDRRCGAVDYEMVGRALHGFARVTAGRVAEGLRELDEVNAAVLAGEMTRPRADRPRRAAT